MPLASDPSDTRGTTPTSLEVVIHSSDAKERVTTHLNPYNNRAPRSITLRMRGEELFPRNVGVTVNEKAKIKLGAFEEYLQ